MDVQPESRSAPERAEQRAEDDYDARDDADHYADGCEGDRHERHGAGV